MPHTVQMCLYKPVRKVSHNHSSAETSSLVKQDIVELLMEGYVFEHIVTGQYETFDYSCVAWMKCRALHTEKLFRGCLEACHVGSEWATSCGRNQEWQ